MPFFEEWISFPWLIIVCQLAGSMEDPQAAISIPMYPDGCFDVVEPILVRRYLEDQAVKMHTVVVAYRALMVLT